MIADHPTIRVYTIGFADNVIKQQGDKERQEVWWNQTWNNLFSLCQIWGFQNDK
jgi:hypothetical protein